ncbi:MAG: ferrous iron transport protein A [Treponema sp.]|nr:ferrous iron transport protein A [Treponema sp.]
MPIYMAQIGEEYLVKKIGGLEETKRHLKNLGFVPGAQVSVVAVMNGNLIVQIKDARVGISREQAGKIII